MVKIDYHLEDLLDRKPILLDSKSISHQITGKVVLITGAAGSIGSEIVRQVADFGPQSIIMLDQAETPLYLLSLEMELLAPHAKLYFEIADISNRAAMLSIFKNYRPDVIYHAAAYKHVQMMEKNPSQAVFANILGTKNMADLACSYNVDTFVMISTDKAVNPGNVMGASKRIAEKYIQALHSKKQMGARKPRTKFLITRFGNVLGSNGSVVPVFSKQIFDGGTVTVTHPEIARYFMTIKEACQLVLEAGAIGKGGEVYIFNMGKQVKILDLAYKMIRMAGFEPGEQVKIKYIGMRPGEKLFEELLTDASKIVPTHNENIMISRETPEDYLYISKCINEIISYAKKFHNTETVSRMKRLVPEYVSANSHFDKLDL